MTLEFLCHLQVCLALTSFPWEKPAACSCSFFLLDYFSLTWSVFKRHLYVQSPWGVPSPTHAPAHVFLFRLLFCFVSLVSCFRNPTVGELATKGRRYPETKERGRQTQDDITYNLSGGVRDRHVNLGGCKIDGSPHTGAIGRGTPAKIDKAGPWPTRVYPNLL